MLTGRGVIVLKHDNHQFHEHGSILLARDEARRLASSLGGKFTIYVPIATVEPMPKTKDTALISAEHMEALDRMVRDGVDVSDDELPF